jgi:hypothetical protein
MNYPKVMVNPLLKKRDKRTTEEILDQPLSLHPKPTTSAQRPFSTKEGGETLMHQRKALQQKPWTAHEPPTGSPELVKK